MGSNVFFGKKRPLFGRLGGVCLRKSQDFRRGFNLLKPRGFMFLCQEQLLSGGGGRGQKVDNPREREKEKEI